MCNQNLNSKILVVAGATGSLGRSIVQHVAACGATVIGISRTADRDTKHLALAVNVDLRYSEGWNKALEQVGRKFGRIDALIHCVGELIPGCVTDLSSEEIDEVIRANFCSVVYGVRSVLPLMQRQGSGHVVVVGSLGGIVPMPFESLYSATKFGVRGFCLSVREELRGSGVILSLIEPGPVASSMLDQEAKDDNSTITFATSILQPECVAHTVRRCLLDPKPEIVLPGRLRFPSLLMNMSPWIFSILYPVCDRLGRRRMLRYRSSNHFQEMYKLGGA